MKRPCQHGAILPKGLKCDRGYLVIRLSTDQGPYFKGCGPHTKDMEKIATLALNDIRKKQYLGMFSLPQKSRQMLFKDVAALYHQRHFVHYRDPKSNKPRSFNTIRNTAKLVDRLIAYFGNMTFDSIKPVDVKEYKTKRVNVDGVVGATFNREKAILASIFSVVATWVKGEEKDIPAIRLPDVNPCDHVPDMEEKARTRLATIEELRRLKSACFELKDPGLWAIIYMELDTSLRQSDLHKLADAPVVNGDIEIEQGKTGRKLILPALANSPRGVVFSNLRKRWEAVRTKAGGMDDLQFRDLRKTGANLLKSVGATLSQIKDALGHASERTTEQHYLLRDAEHIRPAIEAKRKVLDSL